MPAKGYDAENGRASGRPRLTDGPGIGEEVAHVVASGTGGEFIEHVPEAGLENLKGLSKLKTLSLANTRVTNKAELKPY